MDRVISYGFRREIERQESGEEVLCFLTISHPEMNDPIRVVNDPEYFIYGGNEFIGFPFQFEVLSDGDRAPEARLVVQNVDSRIGETLLGLVDPPRVKIEVLALSSFDTSVKPRTEIGTASVEYSADGLYLKDIEGSAMEISGRLINFDYAQTVWPWPPATQTRCPGLYK